VRQLVELQKNIDELRARNVRVYAVSPEEAEALPEVAETHEISFTLLSDPEGEAIRRWGVLNESRPPLPRPTTVLVGAGGEVLWVHEGSVKDRPSIDEVLAAAER
jgi:peroxiredoxin